MTLIGQLLESIAAIAILVCFILVVVQTFKHGKTGMGIACIVLLFCCASGWLVAFVYGWAKHREWGLTNVMIVWTVCWIVLAIGFALSPLDFAALQPFRG